jgi:hypothetical protein
MMDPSERVGAAADAAMLNFALLNSNQDAFAAYISLGIQLYRQGVVDEKGTADWAKALLMDIAGTTLALADQSDPHVAEVLEKLKADGWVDPDDASGDKDTAAPSMG